MAIFIDFWSTYMSYLQVTSTPLSTIWKDFLKFKKKKKYY